jgi:hypothetical protein
MYTHFALGNWEQAMATDVEDARWVTHYVLALLGREEEAIAASRAVEERPLPVLMLRLKKVSRLAMERSRDECVREATPFLSMHAFDPEAIYFTARALAHVGAADVALDGLERAIDRGFSCVPMLLRDPWLDPIRILPRFGALVARADTRCRAAADAFRRAGGEQLLGVTV